MKLYAYIPTCGNYIHDVCPNPVEPIFIFAKLKCLLIDWCQKIHVLDIDSVWYFTEINNLELYQRFHYFTTVDGVINHC